jgi:hypothetical protein
MLERKNKYRDEQGLIDRFPMTSQFLEVLLIVKRIVSLVLISGDIYVHVSNIVDPLLPSVTNS